LSGLAPLPGLTEDYANYHPQAGPYEIANIPYGYTAESGVGITQEMIYQVPQKEKLERLGGGECWEIYPLTWFIQQQTAFPTRPGHQEVEQLGRPQQFMVKQTSLHPLSSNSLSGSESQLGRSANQYCYHTRSTIHSSV